jgi:predicted permease
MLGATPVAGRSFSPDDYRADAAAVAMVNHSLATTLFGEAAGALGHVLRLDGRSYTVIGVMPAEFAFPSPDTRVWLPLSSAPEAWASRTDNSYVAIARVRPGVSLQQASADLNVIARQLERAYPVENANLGVEVAAMRDLIAPQLRTLVLALFGAAFCVLLIACTNLANLLLARAMVRRQEMAVRIAIGAARERLLRQLLTESLVLAVIGGAFGLLLAAGATPFLARLAPTGLPMHAAPHIDMRVFAFAAVVTILTSIAFGVGPALRSFRHADVNALRSRSAAGSGTDRLRAALVLAEVAGTVILLVSAGLLLKAMWRVQAVDPGFRTEGVLTLRTQLPPKYADFAKRRQFYAKVLSQARALPGVTSAGYAAFLPMVFGGGILPVKASGSEQAVPAGMRYVTQDYFTSLGIPLLQGRDVSQQDTTGSPLVTVLSESLAKRLWPAQDPLGRQVRVDDFTWTVVGVVGDVAARGLERSSEPQVYFSADQQTIKTFYAPKDLVIRVSGDPMSLAPAVLKIIRDTDPEQVVSDVRPLADIVALQTAPRRDQLHLLGAFAGIALLLAAVGIHGLLSFAVTARTREIGIRMALGAGRGNVRNMFLRQGFVLGVAGVAIAMPLAYGAARGMTSLLFGVRPEDPLVYAAAAVLALVMTLAGSLRPGIRAASVDPAITIRVE